MSVSGFVLGYPQKWSSFNYLLTLVRPLTLMSAHMSVSEWFSLTSLMSVSEVPLTLTMSASAVTAHAHMSESENHERS
jgi:hypothetical protein